MQHHLRHRESNWIPRGLNKTQVCPSVQNRTVFYSGRLNMKPLLFACLILIAFPAMMFAQMTEKQFTAARLEIGRKRSSCGGNRRRTSYPVITRHPSTRIRPARRSASGLLGRWNSNRRKANHLLTVYRGVHDSVA